MNSKLSSFIRRRILPALAFSAVIVAVAGCETTSTGPVHKQVTPTQAATEHWNSTRATVMGSLAEDQYKNGNFDKARLSVDDALRLDPKSASLHLLSARIAIEQGQLEIADHELASARTLDEKNADADYLSGVICQRWQKFQAAADFYAVAMDKNPREVSYVLARAEMLVATDHRRDALQLLQDKAAFFEHSGAIRDAAGQLLVQEGRYGEAVDQLRAANLLSSDDTQVREHLAMAEFFNREYREASELFTRLLRDPAEDARAELHLAHAQCEVQLGRPAEARAEYEAACRIDPSSTQGWLGVTQTSLAVGDEKRAELSLQRARAIDPTSSDAMLMLGYMNLKQEKYPEAMAAFRTASTLDRNDTTALCMMGYVLEKTGRADQAAQFYAKALRIKPDDELAMKLMSSAN